MGVVAGLTKSDQGARVAKAPRALLGVNDLADSVRARRKEAIVSCFGGGRLLAKVLPFIDC